MSDSFLDTTISEWMAELERCKAISNQKAAPRPGNSVEILTFATHLTSSPLLASRRNATSHETFPWLERKR